MLDLGINGYTHQEVVNQLHGRNGSRGLVKFRYDLLNQYDVKIGELQAQSGRVAMNSLAEIKRTATFQVTEQEGQDIDWLNDRIRPVFCLQMPEISRTYRVWHTVSPTFTRSSVACLSDGTQVAANAPRYEPGKFGKAILLEEGTTNLITDRNLNNWDKMVGTFTITYSGENNYVSLPTVDGWEQIYKAFSVTSGATYTLSLEYRVRASYTGNARVQVLNATPTNSNNPSSEIAYVNLGNTAGDYVKALLTFTPSVSTIYIDFNFGFCGDGQTIQIDLAYLQLEQKPYATSWHPSSCIPAMTADNAPAPYIVSTSFAQYPGNAVYGAFDGAPDTYPMIHSVYGVTTGIINMDLGTAQIVNKYEMMCQTNITTRAPYTWTFEGSNNNLNWTVLDAHIAYTGWVAYTSSFFNFNNSTAYRYYRINVTEANPSNDGYLTLAKIQVYNVRFPESLTIPTAGVLNLAEGEISCRVYVNSQIRQSSVNRYIWAVSDGSISSSPNTLCLRHTVTGHWTFKTTNSGGTACEINITDNLSEDWHMFTCRWNASEIALIIDGATKATYSNPYLPNSYATTMTIGDFPNNPAGIYCINSLIDDLRISNRARTDAEIAAAYASGRATEVDEATTAKFDFDDRLAGEYFTITSEYKPSQQIEWPLGVFLLSSPTRKNENRKIKRDIEAYDASLILKEDKFTDRYRIAAGTKYTTAINDILNSAGIWKIRIIDHPGTLGADKEFEIGTTKLQAINQLLIEINYTSLWVDENGFFTAQAYVLPSSREVEYEYRNNEISIIHPGALEELDLFAVPNQWVRYVSNPDKTIALRSVYTNDLSTSPTSTVNRSRTIVDINSVDDIYDQATLDAYTKRQAYEASQIYAKFEFSTALMPHHSFLDCLFIEHTDFGISSKYIESSWAMDLQAGGRMAHSCRRVIHI